jgi:Flp pilus assembly protein TadB
MSEAIVVALITGGLSLAGVVITCLATAKKTEKAAAVAQAVTDTKLEELTREVREHNHFATRMPAFEQRVDSLEHRVDHLELYHKAPIN